MDIEPRLLRYFLMVARELHFGRAAAKLYVSQPALSEGIKKLETDLNVVLFVRGQRRVELTEAGRVLQMQVPEILRQIDQAAASVLAIARDEARRIRVGYSPFLDLGRIADLRGRLLAHPEWMVEFISAKATELKDLIVAGKISVALMPGPVDDERLTSEVLFTEPFLVGLPGGHPLATRPGVKFQELGGESVVWMPRSFNPAFYDKFIAGCEGLGYRPLITSEVTTLQECLYLVNDHQGITFTTESAQSLKHPGVAFVPLLEPVSVETMVAHHSNTRSAILPSVIEIARAVFSPKRG